MIANYRRFGPLDDTSICDEQHGPIVSSSIDEECPAAGLLCRVDGDAGPGCYTSPLNECFRNTMNRTDMFNNIFNSGNVSQFCASQTCGMSAASACK